MDQIICRSKTDENYSPVGYRRIDVTSHARDVFRTCSPFLCGPVSLYGTYYARNVENAYQFSKVYREHLDKNGNPSTSYFAWAQTGWLSSIAQRRPMGHRHPKYSYWDGHKYDLIESRKHIYLPLYTRAVVKSEGFMELKRLYQAGEKLCLIDYDSYDHEALGYTCADEIVGDERRTLGHCFCLKFLLEGWYPMPRPFRVIVAGSRNFTDFSVLTEFCDKMLQNKREQGIEIISGTAKGADRLGEQYAKQRAFDLKCFPADWNTLGKRAGIVRNQQMGDYADALIAFWDGKSHGTHHMIEYMKKLKKPCRICMI